MQLNFTELVISLVPYVHWDTTATCSEKIYIASFLHKYLLFTVYLQVIYKNAM